MVCDGWAFLHSGLMGRGKITGKRAAKVSITKGKKITFQPTCFKNIEWALFPPLFD